VPARQTLAIADVMAASRTNALVVVTQYLRWVTSRDRLALVVLQVSLGWARALQLTVQSERLITGGTFSGLILALSAI
jgi:hypothetical protein